MSASRPFAIEETCPPPEPATQEEEAEESAGQLEDIGDDPPDRASDNDAVRYCIQAWTRGYNRKRVELDEDAGRPRQNRSQRKISSCIAASRQLHQCARLYRLHHLRRNHRCSPPLGSREFPRFGKNGSLGSAPGGPPPHGRTKARGSAPQAPPTRGK